MNRLLQTYTFGPFERVEKFAYFYKGPASRKTFGLCPGYKVRYYLFGFCVWTSAWRPLP